MLEISNKNVARNKTLSNKLDGFHLVNFEFGA